MSAMILELVLRRQRMFLATIAIFTDFFITISLSIRTFAVSVSMYALEKSVYYKPFICIIKFNIQRESSFAIAQTFVGSAYMWSWETWLQVTYIEIIF